METPDCTDSAVSAHKSIWGIVIRLKEHQQMLLFVHSVEVLIAMTTVQ
jgi:hypothetical protein